jgi:hypothetical protein
MLYSGLAKWIRRISYSLAVLLFLLLLADIFVNYTFENKLRSELKKNREADINFESAHASIFTLSLILKNVDVSYFGKHQKKRFHKFNMDEVYVRGINAFKWWNEQALSAHRILFKNGTIVLDKYLLDQKDSTGAKDENANSMNVTSHSVDFRNVSIKVQQDNKPLLECSGEVHLENFSSQAQKDIKGLAFRLHDVVYPMTGTHGQILYVQDMRVNSHNSEAELNSIRIVTPVDKKKFARQLGFQTDYIDASAKKITIKGLDVLSLRDNRVVSNKITIEKPRLYVYRDRRIPDRDKEERMPDAILADLKTNLRIDTLAINDADVTYEERPADDPDTTGIISFSHTNSVTYHLYNHPAKGELETMTILSQGQLKGHGTVDTKFVFPLVKGKQYYVDGTIKNLDLTSLNNSSINLGHIRINSGQLNTLAFNFSFDHIQSRGKIVGDYNNLVIEKLKVKDGRLKKDKFRSMVEQTIVIPKNKDKSMREKQRTGKINYRRDPNKFVWNFMLNSLLDGIRSSFNFGFLLPG